MKNEMESQSLNSGNLHREFVKLSFDIIKMKNKLISLLLEIYEKEIYKEKGCRTIHEYGFKYAKLSKEVVDKAVRTLRHLENKPFLKQAIETHGIHKVALVATIATAEDEAVFAKHVENMSKAALFEFSKELRSKQKSKDQSSQKLPSFSDVADGEIGSGFFCQAVPNKMKIELDEEMQILFFRFKGKHAKNLSNQEALKLMMKKVGEKSVQEQDIKPGAEIGGEEKNKEQRKKAVPGNETGRHIIKAKNNEIRQKHYHKCAYPGCTKAVEVMHHRVPFAFDRSHESVIPLCDVHHEFAHNGLIAHELKEPENWKLKTAGETSLFDEFYIAKRNEAAKR